MCSKFDHNSGDGIVMTLCLLNCLCMANVSTQKKKKGEEMSYVSKCWKKLLNSLLCSHTFRKSANPIVLMFRALVFFFFFHLQVPSRSYL